MMGISDRMRTYYEDRYRICLTRRTPVIMRLDGKCFHTVTRGCMRPFDDNLALCIDRAATEVCEEVQGAKFAYLQSDEINILVHDYDKFSTDAWFDNNLQKMVSIAAARASVSFSMMFGTEALFDCRAFNLPREEVCNYFISRQLDWQRNSLFMLASIIFSPRQLDGKSQKEMNEMLLSEGRDWNGLPQQWKAGRICQRCSDSNSWGKSPAPIFKDNRSVIEDLLIPTES